MKYLLLIAFALSSLLAHSQIFYKITGQDLAEPSYLFGTHHLAPIDIVKEYNLDAYIDSVSAVIGEVDLTQDQMAMAMQMQSHMIAPADSTLSKLYSPEDYEIINKEFSRLVKMPGAQLSMFEPLKPMVVSTTLASAMITEFWPGYDPAQQLDTHFQKVGKEKGKQIKGLETPEFQATLLFDFTPIRVQAENLLEMAKEPEKNVELTKKLTDAYIAGNLDAMIEVSESEEPNSEFMMAVLDKRNAAWLQELPAIMAEQPVFIAVGALHLAGDQGLVKGLQNAGYTLTPIRPDAK